VAVDIVIHLTDAEQAKVSGWIDQLKPGLSNAEKLTLMVALGRKLIRDELMHRIWHIRQAAAQALNDADTVGFDAPNPLDPVPGGP